MRLKLRPLAVCGNVRAPEVQKKWRLVFECSFLNIKPHIFLIKYSKLMFYFSTLKKRVGTQYIMGHFGPTRAVPITGPLFSRHPLYINLVHLSNF